MEPTKDELAQLELCIADLERRILDTTSRVAFEPGAFGSLQVLHFMEQTLEDWRKRRGVLHHHLNMHLNRHGPGVIYPHHETALPYRRY